MSTSKDYTETLLKDFTIKELKNGCYVPIRILKFFDDCFVGLPWITSDAHESDESFDAFIIKFEEYVNNRKKAMDSSTPLLPQGSVYVHRLDDTLDRWSVLTERLSSVRSEKNISYTKVLSTLNCFYKLRAEYRDHIKRQTECAVNQFHKMSIQLKILNNKIMSRPLKLSPILPQAFSQLLHELKIQLEDCNKSLRDAEDLIARYEEVEKNPEFMKLLNTFTKLLQRKQTLALSESEM